MYVCMCVSAAIGYETVVSPYWSHALQIWALTTLPEVCALTRPDLTRPIEIGCDVYVYVCVSGWCRG